MVRDAGLAITLFQPFRDFEGMPEPQRARAFDRAERKFDLMQELGTDLMLVCSNVSPLALGGIDRAAADFRELGERAAKRGLRVGYEALAWGRHVNDHRDAWEIVRRADHPRGGPDPRLLPHAAREIDVDRSASIPATGSSSCSWPTRRCSTWTCSPGAAISAACRARAISPSRTSWSARRGDRLRGLLSLEIFNDQFRAGSAAARLRSTDGVPDAPAWRPAPGSAAQIFRTRARCKGVAFVEFAADEASAELLETACSTPLEFPAERGRHLSKEVTVVAPEAISTWSSIASGRGFAHFLLPHPWTGCVIHQPRGR